MKVVVTGGLGQIGSHVAEMLLERGDSVLGIDNLATGRREHLANHPNLKIVIDTIADKGLVDRLMGDFKADAVVHTAASYKDPDDWYNLGKRFASTETSEKQLRFKAQVDIRERVRRTVEWTKANVQLIKHSIARHEKLMKQHEA